MSVLWRSFSGFVETLVAAVVAKANATVDTSVGSITLAWAQAVGGVALWLQAENARVLALTRAATSNGSDLDSFYADFGFFRLGDIAATGSVTFSRYLPTVQALVPIGAIVSTGPGGLQFAVTIDTTNAAYSSVLNGYVIAIGVGSVTVPVTCLSTGSIGNVLAYTIQSFGQAIPYVDTVTNTNALVDGVDTETDVQFRTRFPLWIAGLACADESAVASAIANIQVGIRYLIVENYDYPGTTWDPGSFFVIVDDGSGTPPTSLLTTVSNAVNNIRGVGIRYAVYPPSLLPVNVTMTIVTAAGYVHTAVASAVATAITNYLSGAQLDTTVVSVGLLIQLAMNTTGVTNVILSTVYLNGINADLPVALVQRPVAGQVTVS